MGGWACLVWEDGCILCGRMSVSCERMGVSCVGGWACLV